MPGWLPPPFYWTALCWVTSRLPLGAPGALPGLHVQKANSGPEMLRTSLGHPDPSHYLHGPESLLISREDPLFPPCCAPWPLGLWVWGHSSRRHCHLARPQPLPDPGILAQWLAPSDDSLPTPARAHMDGTARRGWPAGPTGPLHRSFSPPPAESCAQGTHPWVCTLSLPPARCVALGNYLASLSPVSQSVKWRQRDPTAVRSTRQTG